MLVLDVSASMQTRSGGGTTRFDQALAEAAAIVDGLPRDGRILVMTSGRKAPLRTGFESDRGALRQALAQLRAGDEVGGPREALALALSLLRGREDGRIYFLTDGAFDPDVDPGSPQVVFRVVGGRAQRCHHPLRLPPGACQRRPLPGADDGAQLHRCAGGGAGVGEPGRPRAPSAAPSSLQRAAKQTLVLPFIGRALGQAVARIDADDDLAADNHGVCGGGLGRSPPRAHVHAR